jgi:NAD(P)-dependent dehydrogenase (short-subunit alcohol dehydrogenase family)
MSGLDALFGLHGRVALVTGAAGHLGREIAVALSTAGAHTWLAGRSRLPLDALAAQLTADGHTCDVAVCDVTSDHDVDELMRQIGAQHDRLDVLVSNAHVGRTGTLRTATPADYHEACELALVATNRLINAGRQLLTKATVDGSPCVIAMSSMYGLVSPQPRRYPTTEAVNPPYYGAVKAGLIQLARYAAVELAPLGIRVNSITPGPFPATGSEQFHQTLADAVPLGRIGQPAEIATAVLFLASPKSSFVTGANIPVDGGWTTW